MRVLLYILSLTLCSCANLDYESIINDLKNPRPFSSPEFSKMMRWHQNLMHEQFMHIQCRKMPRCELYSGTLPLI